MDSSQKENKKFPPPRSFSQAAHLGNLGEYQEMYEEGRHMDQSRPMFGVSRILDSDQLTISGIMN